MPPSDPQMSRHDTQIDSRADISPRAKLANGVRIGPYAVVGDDVELGEGCVLHSHAVVGGPSRFGAGNIFFPFSAVGLAPQDLKYQGEPTRLEAGAENTFREYVTVSRGTVSGGGVTTIGSHNLFMAYSHVAHDCHVADHTIFVNGATLAGHVTVEDHATVGAFCPVHQFCRIGRYAYIPANTVVTQDVLPFSLTVAPRETRCFGPNTIGLERGGFSRERVARIERAFRLLLRSKLNTTQALERMREELGDSDDVQQMIRFIESATRGIAK